VKHHSKACQQQHALVRMTSVWPLLMTLATEYSQGNRGFSPKLFDLLCKAFLVTAARKKIPFNAECLVISMSLLIFMLHFYG